MNTTVSQTAEEQMRTDSIACGTVLASLLVGAVCIVVLLV
jgi:hypothetical protein